MNLLLASEIEHILPKNIYFVTCEYLRGNLRVRLATQRKSLRKFNLRPLATTCRSVWPGLNDFNCILEEKLELLEQQPVNDSVETFLDESPTASEKNSEMKKTDFVKLNDGNLLKKGISKCKTG